MATGGLCDEIFDENDGKGPKDDDGNRRAGEVEWKHDWKFTEEDSEVVGHNCKDDSGDIGEAQRCKCTVKITDIVVTLDCTITMPEWSGYGDANDDEQDEWDSFITGLREHERGHVGIAKEWRKKIEETLEEECVDKNITARGSTPKEACKNALQKLKDTIKNKFDELTDEHEKEQDEYDNETDHGADQGATLGCDSDGGDGGGDDSGDGD